MHDSCETLIDNKNSSPKLTLAVVGDGFDEAYLDKYKSWVQDELIGGVFDRDIMKECRSAFNVIRIDLVSIHSGVSQKRYDEHGTPNDPNDDNIASETFRWTRLGYLYSGSWAHCWLEPKSTTNAALLKVLKRFCPNYDFVLIVLNENGPGGCGGGGRQVVTLGEDWSTIVHEFGHGMFGLNDEYQRPGKTFTGSSWSGPNCSVNADRATLKWADLVDANTPLPTTATPSGWNDNTDVGAFEGCGTYEKGLYRPVKECRMRSNTPPFCPVCSRVIRQFLQPYL
ncbi:M64 family metallopeptidase [Methanomethylovorans sp. PtaU1.Bin093]|uniref:M64 family metallopeptidase n=1 Tax=Methanomethylovorans sp. PtaU1.Bin093 TaxID=1811679 RepID=UPI0025DB9B5E|nr:M64 family metallopeptidase [Methanomethylovorans sp. PtaU1.Bin093]